MGEKNRCSIAGSRGTTAPERRASALLSGAFLFFILSNFTALYGRVYMFIWLDILTKYAIISTRVNGLSLRQPALCRRSAILFVERQVAHDYNC